MSSMKVRAYPRTRKSFRATAKSFPRVASDLSSCVGTQARIAALTYLRQVCSDIPRVGKSRSPRASGAREPFAREGTHHGCTELSRIATLRGYVVRPDRLRRTGGGPDRGLRPRFPAERV